MSEQKLSDAWQCQSCGCYFPHIPKILDNDIKRCSKCVEVEILEAKLEAMERALRAVEWQPIHDPDTHELLGQLCLWCHRKPHTIHCERQKALAAI